MVDSSNDDILDLLIIGAGVYGICAANTYLTLHPEAHIKVLDSDENVGGVWSTSRLYPQFWSQTGQRLCGYPDKPFHVPEGAELYHDLFEAKHLSKYLEEYVSERSYDGRSLRDRVVFRCWVESVEKVDARWRVRAKLDGREVAYQAKHLIVATGMSSVPYIPDLPGKESFKGPILHQKEFGPSKIFTPDESDAEAHTHITVLGGSKSASDIAYAAATDTNAPTQRKVSWIIRTSGTGPLQFTNPKAPKGLGGKFRNLPETGSTRAIAGLSSANPYVSENWWTWFLHKTFVGQWFLERVWGQAAKESDAAADFYGREGRLPGFEGLRSETEIRWRSGPLGIQQRDDFWDVIARKVQVYRQDVRELKEGAVVLEDGTEVRTDVLLCGTGWRQEHRYFGVDEAARLGLPISRHDNEKFVDEERNHWSRLEEEADRKVLARWPYLSAVPQRKKPNSTTTSYKLFNLTLPIHDHSIAFLGLALVPNSYHTALAQTLYAIAALDGHLQLPSTETMEKDIAFINRWCSRRYPTYGNMGTVRDYEMVSFTDHLLAQLGLSSHRSKGSWWRDMTDPVLAGDYAGVVDEYRRMYMKEKHEG